MQQSLFCKHTKLCITVYHNGGWKNDAELPTK